MTGTRRAPATSSAAPLCTASSLPDTKRRRNFVQTMMTKRKRRDSAADINNDIIKNYTYIIMCVLSWKLLTYIPERELEWLAERHFQE